MIRNLSKNTLLSKKTHNATSFRDRLQGMIAREFCCFDAILFSKCSSIHTMFMSYPIDVVFLSEDNVVRRIVPSCHPWIPAVVGGRNASKVVETPAGMIKQAKIEIGDKLEISFDTKS